ncbi:hypothetical protein [Streptomyces sp. NPDC005907]|uniref:hypothetical protein n=1 Tax=Streptomyces sp. NPDC005907 TaxID=3154571 RepID=UPI0033F691AF
MVDDEPRECACDGQTLLEIHTQETCYDRRDVDETNRDERIETLYQGWGARDMAERIVDLGDELGADVDGNCTGMHADVAEAHAEIERLRAQVDSFHGWRGSVYEVARHTFRSAGRAKKSAERYRLAWLSARRRAADEANFGMEALALRDEEIRRLRAELDHIRKTTHGSPRLEAVTTEEDGSVVWRLVTGDRIR